MNKKVINKEKVIRNLLIISVIISLIVKSLHYTYLIYNEEFDTFVLNNLLVSQPFTILLWIDNLLVYLLGIWYMILGIKSKQEVVVKVSFSVLAILTTIVSSTFAVNIVAKVFGLF